jgi:hypothetical protein
MTDWQRGEPTDDGTKPSPPTSRGILRDARYLVAVGRLERARWYHSLWAFQLTGVTGNAASRPA